MTIVPTFGALYEFTLHDIQILYRIVYRILLVQSVAAALRSSTKRCISRGSVHLQQQDDELTPVCKFRVRYGPGW